MAAMTSTTTTPSQRPQASSPSSSSTLDPSRTPLPLSASQEAQVRDLYHKRVRAKCADEVRDFAACATNRTFTSTFMCRQQQKAMNSCMVRYATRSEEDAAREEWFATLDARREERERKEEKRKKDEIFWKEWWAKDKDRVRKGGETEGLEGRK